MIGLVSRRVPSPILVGRAGEAAQLRAAYERAGAATATTVVVAGEAGVGKTRLVDDMVATVRACGGPVIAGGCIDLGDHGMPFAPFIDGLRSLAREHPDDVEAALSADGPELWRLMPGRSGPSNEAADGGVGQARLFEQVLMLLDRLGRSPRSWSSWRTCTGPTDRPGT